MNTCATETEQYHQPVLLNELVDALAVDETGCYVDATYGRGGHSRAVLDNLGPAGRLIAFDKDPQACEHARRNFGGDPRFEIHCQSFTQINDLQEDFSGKVAGIFFDLGVSLPQLKTAGRGFSFSLDGPLDMRMNPQAGRSVADWLESATYKEIYRVLKKYGEEPHAKVITKRIVKSFSEGFPVLSTEDLASLITSALPYRDARKSCARVFLAFRLHINRELEDLEDALKAVTTLLRSGGRFVAISFHSLEDRIVKRFIRKHSVSPMTLRGLPAPSNVRLVLRQIEKVIYPSDEEVAHNPQSRSARMRVAERV